MWTMGLFVVVMPVLVVDRALFMKQGGVLPSKMNGIGGVS